MRLSKASSSPSTPVPVSCTSLPLLARDDYRIAQEKGIGILQLIAPDGTFLPEATDFAGRFCKEADPDIIRWMKDKGVLSQA